MAIIKIRVYCVDFVVFFVGRHLNRPCIEDEPKTERPSFNINYLLVVFCAMPGRQMDCRYASNFDST